MVSGVLSLAERSIRTIMTPRSEMEWIDVSDSEDEIRALLQRAPTACSRSVTGSWTRSSGWSRLGICCLPSTRGNPWQH